MKPNEAQKKIACDYIGFFYRHVTLLQEVRQEIALGANILVEREPAPNTAPTIFRGRKSFQL
jgi:hypothetical protein